MRLSTFTIALAALLLSGTAGAAGGPDKQAGKGAQGPSVSGEGPSGGNGASSADTHDRADTGTATEKVWDVGAGLEYHHMLAPADVLNARNRNVNYWSASARWDITPYDRVQASFGVYQYFLRDAQEPAARLDDLYLAYARRIPLPGEVTLRVTPALILPTSFGSQLSGLYFSPQLSVQADRKFGRYFSLDARLRGSVYVFKATAGGGAFTDAGLGGFGNADPANGAANPNPKGSFAMRLTADLAMPFHEPLSVSVSAYTSYSWYYGVCGQGMVGADQDPSRFGMAAPSTGTCTAQPAVMSDGQPMQQFYGYDITARYAFPSLKGFKIDASFTFAPLGDTTLGYTSVRHGNGAAGVMPYYRQTAEIFAGLNGHY